MPGCISPTRLPMSLPKIRKYSVIVIAGGSSVWLQMRRMRVISRRTMVPSAISVPVLFMRRLRNSPLPQAQLGGGGVPLLRHCSCGGLVVGFDESHEQFFEAIGLVAHRHHGD